MTISEMYRRVTNAINGLDNEIYNIVVDLEPDMVESQQERLFEGKYPTGEIIFPPYKPFTIFMKTIKEQPTDRVTLKDTGDFHRGIFVKKQGENLIIDSTDEKSAKLQEKYGENIFGFTAENKTTLKKQTHQKIVNYVKSKIRG